MKTTAPTCHCYICGKTFPKSETRPIGALRPGIIALITAAKPGWEQTDNICLADLRDFRGQYVEAMLAQERGELSDLDRQVIDSLANGEIITQALVTDVRENASFGERAADRVATFGGSWTFIMMFAGILFVWMGLNITALLFKPFDPYPFILLNLVLSSLAALQAPVIMMSQRRQETKDRMRAENDYRVNLKAELEIRQLHEKIDHQLAHQWDKLAALQQIQIELLEEAAHANRHPRG